MAGPKDYHMFPCLPVLRNAFKIIGCKVPISFLPVVLQWWESLSTNENTGVFLTWQSCALLALQNSGCIFITHTYSAPNNSSDNTVYCTIIAINSKYWAMWVRNQCTRLSHIKETSQITSITQIKRCRQDMGGYGKIGRDMTKGKCPANMNQN